MLDIWLSGLEQAWSPQKKRNRQQLFRWKPMTEAQWFSSMGSILKHLKTIQQVMILGKSCHKSRAKTRSHVHNWNKVSWPALSACGLLWILLWNLPKLHSGLVSVGSQLVLVMQRPPWPAGVQHGWEWASELATTPRLPARGSTCSGSVWRPRPKARAPHKTIKPVELQ